MSPPELQANMENLCKLTYDSLIEVILTKTQLSSMCCLSAAADLGFSSTAACVGIQGHGEDAYSFKHHTRLQEFFAALHVVSNLMHCTKNSAERRGAGFGAPRNSLKQRPKSKNLCSYGVGQSSPAARSRLSPRRRPGRARVAPQAYSPRTCAEHPLETPSASKPWRSLAHPYPRWRKLTPDSGEVSAVLRNPFDERKRMLWLLWRACSMKKRHGSKRQYGLYDMDCTTWLKPVDEIRKTPLHGAPSGQEAMVWPRNGRVSTHRGPD